MGYKVMFVEDAQLPASVEWTFARTPESTYLFVRHSSIDTSTGCCAALARAWGAWQSVQLEELAGAL